MKTPEQSSTERYLRRATWGLWGRKRRDAQAELRGVIEDKRWRFKLLGLSDPEAEAQALAELGRPGEVAAGLSRVHSLPLALQGALLAGVLGALGVQMVGAAAGVRATTYNPSERNCDFSQSGLEQIPHSYRQSLLTALKNIGNRTEAEQLCLENTPTNWLNLNDLLSGLQKGGLSVEEMKGTKYSYSLSLPADSRTTSIDFGRHFLREHDGIPYVLAQFFFADLISGTNWPLKLSGIENPILSVGTATVQLGTSETPIRATNLYNLILDQRWTKEPVFLYQKTTLNNGVTNSVTAGNMTLWPDSGRQAGADIQVSAPDNTLYAVIMVGRGGPPCEACDTRFFAGVRAVKNGQLWLGEQLLDAEVQPSRFVGSFAELGKAGRTQGSDHAALLLKLTSGDLRNISYQVVAPSQIKLFPAGRSASIKTSR